MDISFLLFSLGLVYFGISVVTLSVVLNLDVTYIKGRTQARKLRAEIKRILRILFIEFIFFCLLFVIFSIGELSYMSVIVLIIFNIYQLVILWRVVQIKFSISEAIRDE